MFRHPFVPVAALILAAGSLSAACSSETPAAAATPATPEPAVVTTAAVESRPIERHLRVTGSLLADEQAEVSAELAGRVTATPVERGSRVPAGALLVRISASETSAQLQEAEANAGQMEARLGLSHGQAFDPRHGPAGMHDKSATHLA